MELHAKLVRSQLSFFKPFVAGLSLEATRKGQDKLGELMTALHRREVLVRDHDFEHFQGAWVMPKDQRRTGVILYLHGGGYTCGSLEYAKGFGAKGLAYLAIHEDGSYKCSFGKFMKEEELDALVKAMDGKPGDLLFFAADKDKVVFDVLGNLRLELARQLDLLKKDDFKFLWVTEFPLLEYSEEEDRYVAMHHPFTMPMEEDIPLLDSDPGAVRAKAYDIVLNGTELGGGSVRIHQGDIQEKMFEVLGFTPERANEQFGFLLDAFKYGVPPHAGLAYGLDRVIMLMVGADSIRDVIAFPKVKDASCLMMEAPSEVDVKQLEELHIAVVPEEKEQE